MKLTSSFLVFTTGLVFVSANFCTKESNMHLLPSHASRECHTFHSNPCLCTLNGNCVYDDGKKSCNNALDCSTFNHQPFICNANHCTYDCGTRTCFLKQDFQECSTKLTCNNQCFDICSCKISGCEYDTKTGACRTTGTTACAESAEAMRRCGRNNGIYFREGTYCAMLHARRDCVVQENVIAVNINGDRLTDSRGITYEAGASITMIDPDNVAVSFKKTIDTDSANRDVLLYATGIYGNPAKRKNNRCVTFNFTICEDGFYELLVKTVQLTDVNIGEKLFNIKLGDRLVFPEVDVGKFAKGHLHPVDFVVNFHVSNNVITVPGDAHPIRLEEGNITLSFCYGTCIFAEGFFEVSAFHVVRLMDWDELSPEHCADLNDKPFECSQSKCVYNESSGQCSHKEKGDLCQPSKSCPKVKKECLNFNVSRMIVVAELCIWKDIEKNSYTILRRPEDGGSRSTLKKILPANSILAFGVQEGSGIRFKFQIVSKIPHAVGPCTSYEVVIREVPPNPNNCFLVVQNSWLTLACYPNSQPDMKDIIVHIRAFNVNVGAKHVVICTSPHNDYCHKDDLPYVNIHGICNPRLWFSHISI